MAKLVERFKKWAFAEWKHFDEKGNVVRGKVPGPKLIVHEDLVDFIHGSLIGLLVGYLVGLLIVTNTSLGL